MDRISDSGSEDMGSNPVGITKLKPCKYFAYRALIVFLQVLYHYIEKAGLLSPFFIFIIISGIHVTAIGSKHS